VLIPPPDLWIGAQRPFAGAGEPLTAVPPWQARCPAMAALLIAAEGGHGPYDITG
jgi:hypothetical protein